MLSGNARQSRRRFRANLFCLLQTRSLFYIKLIITCKLICKYVSMEGKKDIIAHLGSKCECLACTVCLVDSSLIFVFFFLLGWHQDHIIEQIFGYLDYQSLINSGSISEEWREHFLNRRLWKQLFRRNVKLHPCKVVLKSTC